MDSEKILLSKKDAASLLSLSVRSLEYMLQRRELVSRRVGRRVLIPRTALEQFAKRDHPTRPDGQGGQQNDPA